jgi:hypothetical protein
VGEALPFASRSLIGANMVPQNSMKAVRVLVVLAQVCDARSVTSRLIFAIDEESRARTGPGRRPAR